MVQNHLRVALDMLSQRFAPKPDSFDRGLFGDDTAPYEMSQEEYINSDSGISSLFSSWKRHSDTDIEDPKVIERATEITVERHKQSIQEALYRGEEVAEDILAAYPELQYDPESFQDWVPLYSFDIMDLRKSNHVYRGMAAAEFEETVGQGKGVRSDLRGSLTGEGTCFAIHPGTCLSYALSGRGSPEETGQPAYVVEVVSSEETMHKDHDEYVKTRDQEYWVPQEDISRIWEIDMQDEKYYIREVAIP